MRKTVRNQANSSAGMLFGGRFSQSAAKKLLVFLALFILASGAYIFYITNLKQLQQKSNSVESSPSMAVSQDVVRLQGASISGDSDYQSLTLKMSDRAHYSVKFIEDNQTLEGCFD